MNLCVIGNGASALNAANGDFIDSCDVVVRVGNFVITNYENYIGTKTDVFVCRWYKCKNRPQEFFKTLKEFWIPRTIETREKKYDDLVNLHGVGGIIKYIPKELVFGYKARYPFRYIKNNLSRAGNSELHCCIPDSGIVAIDMARHFYPNHKIYITGFDNCVTGYYWDVDNVLDKTGEDLLHLQFLYLKSLLKNGIVTDLCNGI
jgi:hypothetical protein